MRAYVKPRNPDTPAQRKNRDLFRAAMKAWQDLPSYDRASYNRRAARLGMTGHNLFISRYILSHRADKCGENRMEAPKPGIRPVSRPSSSIPVQYRSVSGPIVRRCAQNPPSERLPGTECRNGPLIFKARSRKIHVNDYAREGKGAEHDKRVMVPVAPALVVKYAQDKTAGR